MVGFFYSFKTFLKFLTFKAHLINSFNQTSSRYRFCAKIWKSTTKLVSVFLLYHEELSLLWSCQIRKLSNRSFAWVASSHINFKFGYIFFHFLYLPFNEIFWFCWGFRECIAQKIYSHCVYQVPHYVSKYWKIKKQLKSQKRTMMVIISLHPHVEKQHFIMILLVIDFLRVHSPICHSRVFWDSLGNIAKD